MPDLHIISLTSSDFDYYTKFHLIVATEMLFNYPRMAMVMMVIHLKMMLSCVTSCLSHGSVRWEVRDIYIWKTWREASPLEGLLRETSIMKEY